MLNAKANNSVPHRQKNSGIIVESRPWGFVVVQGKKSQKIAFWGEVGALIGALCFGVAAYGQWLWPGLDQGTGLFPAKMGVTVLFFVMAFRLYKIVRTGLRYEIQVDVNAKKVGFVRRNMDGQGSVEKRIGFDDIQSLYIKRPNISHQKGELFLSRQGRKATLVAKAPMVDLEPLLDRMRKSCAISASTRVIPTKTRAIQGLQQVA